MASDDANTHQDDNDKTVNTLTHTEVSTTKRTLDELAIYLTESFRITEDAISYKNRRKFIKLKAQSIFDALVDLYTSMFNSNWNHFKRISDNFKNLTASPPGSPKSVTDRLLDAASGEGTSTQQEEEATPEPTKIMARVYISHWILDLYRSIREVCPDLSGLAFHAQFSHPMEEQSPIYDAYLALLNAHIRPTPLTGILEDALFIPHFEADNPTKTFAKSSNPFRIDKFMYRPDYFRSIINAIQERRSGWSVKPKSTAQIGRPTWLFDWPTSQSMCAWFPMDPNFTADDCTVAYILGVACTSKLAPCDVDDFQPWRHNVAPNPLNLGTLVRARPLVREPGYLHRVIDVKTTQNIVFVNPYNDLMTTVVRHAKRRRVDSTPQTSSGALVIRDVSAQHMEIDTNMPETFTHQLNGYRITDYIYKFRLIRKSTDAQRKLFLSDMLKDIA